MAYLPQTSFSRGELHPEMHASQHLTAYRSAVAEARDVIVLKRGGLRRRGGTKFVAEIKDSTAGAALIPFAFNTAQTYMLEFGEQYYRVYQSGGRVGTVEVVTPYSVAEAKALSHANSRDVVYLAHGSHKLREVQRLSDASWALEEAEIKDGPYLTQNTTATTLTPSETGAATPEMTGNTAPSGTASVTGGTVNLGAAWSLFDRDKSTTMRVATTSGAAEFNFGGGVTKVVDAYFITAGGDPDKAPTSWKLEGFNGTDYVTLDSRESVSDWVGTDTKFFEFSNETAYEAYRLEWYNNVGKSESDTSMTEIGFHESAATQTPFNLSASSTEGINDGAGFQASDVGRPIRLIGEDGVSRWAEIVTVPGNQLVTVRLYGHALPSTSPISRWALGAWSDETGWPKHVVFYNERLALAANTNSPASIWTSKSRDFSDFGVSSPLESGDAIDIEILGREVNEIEWLVEDEELVAGTARSIRRLGRVSSSEAFGPENVTQNPANSVGCNDIQAISIGSTVLYLSRFGRKLLELIYDFGVNGYISNDISIFSSHLFRDGVTAMAYQENPESILWLVDADGGLISLTYEREQEVYGFAHHDVGGVVEDVSVISTASQDEVWLIVRRDIDGQTKRYLEVLQDPFDEGDIEDAWHVDCGSVYEGATASTISGLDYLEGQEVAIHGDGMDLGTYEVSGGSVTLSQSVTKAIIGLPFKSRIKMLEPVLQSQRDGSGQGRHMRPDVCHIRVHETGSLKTGSDLTGVDQEIITFEEGDPVGASPLRSGWITVSPQIRWEEDGQIVFEMTGTLPGTLTAVNLGMEGEP